MFKKKALCLLFCLVFSFGCGGVNTKSAGQITLAPAASRTVCIQTDPAKPDTAVLVQPLEAQLRSKGYRIVATPQEAAYTIRLRLAAFGLNARRPSTDAGPSVGLVAESSSGKGSNVGNAPLVLGSTGTAIGGAVSGSSLHAARTTGGAVGGFAGLGAGLVIGSLLGGPSGPDFKTNLHVPFNAEVDIIITDSSSGQQQATVLAAWKKVSREGQAPAAREDVVNKLAGQIAALMP
ncbi:MAG: complement resistance protein TraT [Syntrophobacterales bacterium]|jgi:hypothetical protein|nr:complement resistance protein TraT [Syntrophobacterales bacterium]